MSFVFDTMQQAVDSLDGPEAVKWRLRLMLDRLHQISHEQEDALNFDERLRRHAASLAKWLEG